MAAMAAVTLIETRGLSRSFGGLKAVADVDFKLPQGEIRAIIGPNGAGKTTFVSIVAGRIRPSSGQIIFSGEDITSLPAFQRVRRGIAYTFQITSIFAKLSVQQNVALAAQGRGARISIGPILDQVGLGDRADQIAGTLAYGHQRLLEIAMGLALCPKLLILDEPTQGLSDAESDNFVALVKRVGPDTTVLLIEHNMDVVMAAAERITVFNQGRILAEGTPAEISADAAVQRAYLGSG